MKIFSVDNNCFVTLEYKGDPTGYSGFHVEIHADIRHGKFDARNIDVQFLNLEEFVSELDKFILDRSCTPRLEGTYNTYFVFSATGNAVILKYQLGDVFCGRKTSYFYQSGEFEIEQESLLKYLGDFRAMEAQQGEPPRLSWRPFGLSAGR